MSLPPAQRYEAVGTDAPPTYEEAIHIDGATKEAAPYPKQEMPIGAPKTAPYPNQQLPAGIPVMLTTPVPLRDVGSGNIVYIVNQPGRSEPMDSNLPFGASFGTKQIRAVFVRKVYATLMLQLLVTVVFIAWFMFHEQTRIFVRRHVIILLVAYLTFLVTYLILVCCSNVRRMWPCNFIMLSIFTLSMSYWAATISAFHDTYIVLMTVGIVTIVCLGITLFSIQTKWDITGAGLYLFVFMLVVLVFGIIAIVVAKTTGSRVMTVVYAGLLALVFSLYLVYDTQQIIGGRKVELSPEEHVFGALQLYIDIVQFYLILLSLSSNSCK